MPSLLLFAEITGPVVPLTACALVGGSILVMAWWIAATLRSTDLEQGGEWRYDVSRINELRRVDYTYRFFQPLIQALAVVNRRAFGRTLVDMQREIQAAGMPRFWLAEEYLAKLELIAILLAPTLFYFGFHALGLPGLIVALASVIVLGWLLRRRLAGKARARVQAIKRRMPFLLDLLTLLMEAGSNFLRSLEQAIQEFAGHPVAVEFGRVLSDMSMGKTRTEAFEALDRRLNDDEIKSIIGSILQGENLGTPLASVFRTQADVLRIKRSQRAETVAGEAGVNMLLPGILIMGSTVLIILGPFALNYIYSGLEF